MRKKFFYPILLVGTILMLSVLLYNSKADSTLINEVGNIVETTISPIEDVPSEITLDDENGKRFIVPISSIPDLENYLETEMDIKTELERIQVEFLNLNSANENYFVLKYGCGIKICNLVLVQITETNEVKTIFLTVGIFTGSEVFEQKAIFRIAVNEGNEIVRHQIMIVDLNTMNILHPIDKNADEYYFKSPLYPITEFKWITQDSIELVVADISDTTYETIENWYKVTSPSVKSEKISIE